MTSLPWIDFTRFAAAALGVSIAWATALAWIGALLFTEYGTDYETIQVTTAGDPVVVVHSRTSSNYYDSSTYRTLDGQAIKKAPQMLRGDTLPTRRSSPGLYAVPIVWSERLAGLTSYTEPVVAWYAVRDAALPGRLQFEGFDVVTRRAIGFMSRKGFTRTRPSAADGFDVGEATLGWSDAVVVAHSYFEPGGKATTYSPAYSNSKTANRVYFRDGDTVGEFNLEQRTFRVVAKVSNLASLAIVGERLPGAKEDDADSDSDEAQEQRLHLRVAARGDERIVLAELDGEKSEEFVIPESLRNTGFTLYAVDGELLAIVSPPGTMQRTTQVIRFDETGKITARHEVELAGFTPESEETMAWTMVPVGPVPAAWGLALGMVAPLTMVQSNAEPNYAAGVRHAFNVTWKPFALICAIALACAAWALAKHRRWHREHPLAWATLVFLFGPIGLVCYWLEFRREPRMTCAACGRVVPRNHDECPACRAAWARPAALGTEIFAA